MKRTIHGSRCRHLLPLSAVNRAAALANLEFLGLGRLHFGADFRLLSFYGLEAISCGPAFAAAGDWIW